MSKSIDRTHIPRVDHSLHDGSTATALLADISRLLLAFSLWKIFLTAVIIASPGAGYDTSTELLFSQYDGPPKEGLGRLLYDLSLRLTRWDGIYFAASSTHGHIHEQQWAFSWLLTRFTARLADVPFLPQSLTPIVKHALTGSLLSICSHLFTVLALYVLIEKILPSSSQRRRQIALTTAYLHIISPAGVFLQAPSAEAPFALITILGMLSYAHAIQARTRAHAATELIWMLISGSLFGLSTTLRGNGILSGLIFAWDTLKPTFDLVFGARNLLNLRRLLTAGAAGLLVAIGFAGPQYIAYQNYCTGETQRPWCAKVPPSIYSWVQSEYWNVGLFKYWTPGNIPLFMLAAPMVFLLINTGYAALHHSRSLLIAVNGEDRPARMKSTAYQAQRLAFEHVLERMAVPQMVLAAMGVTSFHVQIINRISSAYPVCYLVLAIALHDQSPILECGHARSEHYYPFRLLHGKLLKLIVQGFVVYAVVQAGLYSAFLPPA